MTAFGLHTAPQGVGVAELVETWQEAERAGFDVVSVWDHLETEGGYGPVGSGNFDAVAMHTLLAASTSRVRCGCMVYAASYRPLATLVRAALTIDHISNGRAEIGLGAGWAEPEFQRWGIGFGSVSDRMTRLEEYARAARRLLDGETVSVNGEFVTLAEAAARPMPQQRMRLWIGGAGPRRLLPLAAEVADGWNYPYPSVTDFQMRLAIFRDLEQTASRDARALVSVNLAFALDDRDLERQFNEFTPVFAPGAVVGAGRPSIDKVAQYIEAGADEVNFVVRPPVPPEALPAISSIMAALS
jgi:alkanesulfonate monooxygenase SsuD/methylene tetrahydromethanopterin reductase-like flavin-dependent oxidoreductase (luciferase family)